MVLIHVILYIRLHTVSHKRAPHSCARRCVCELVFALNFDLVPHRTKVAGPSVFRGETQSCLVAACWSDEDKQKILQYIIDSSSYAEVDRRIGVFRSMLIADVAV